MLDAHASVLITADAVWRGPKLIALKEIADDGWYLLLPLKI